MTLALANELGMRPLLAHCHPGTRPCHDRPSWRTAGRRHRLYRDMDMTFWLPQAEAALAQMV
jgi:hypothetical protein